MNSRHDARATYTAKAQTTAQLEAASSWTREAGGALSAIGMVPAMRPRALLGASCEGNDSKEKTLKSGVVGSRALAGQGLKQADFTFQDPSRGLLYTPVHPDSRRTNSSCGLSAEALVHFFIASPPAYPTTVTCGTPAMAHLSFPYKLVPWHSLIQRTHHLLLHL